MAKIKLPRFLTTVTPFSKGVAFGMFILLPTLTFRIGYDYAGTIFSNAMVQSKQFIQTKPPAPIKAAPIVKTYPGNLIPVNDYDSNIVLLNNRKIIGNINSSGGMLSVSLPQESGWEAKTSNGITYGLKDKFSETRLQLYKKDTSFSLDKYIDSLTEQNDYTEMVATDSVIIKTLKPIPPIEPYVKTNLKEESLTADRVILKHQLTFGEDWIIDTKDHIIIISVSSGCESGCESANEQERKELIKVRDEMLKTLTLQYYN
jgi:hypothetical protein